MSTAKRLSITQHSFITFFNKMNPITLLLSHTFFQLFEGRTRLLDVFADSALRHQNLAAWRLGELHRIINVLAFLVFSQRMRMSVRLMEHHPFSITKPFATTLFVALYWLCIVFALLCFLDQLFRRQFDSLLFACSGQVWAVPGVDLRL